VSQRLRAGERFIHGASRSERAACRAGRTLLGSGIGAPPPRTLFAWPEARSPTGEARKIDNSLQIDQ
jgi:hypothetical protein